MNTEFTFSKLLFAVWLVVAYGTSIDVIAAVPQEGVTYTYDLTGNRIARKPNTIIIRADETSGSTGGQMVVLKDSFLGDALRVSYAEGIGSLEVRLSEILLSDSGSARIEILSASPGSTPLWSINYIDRSQRVDMTRFTPGDYVMRICFGDNILSAWSIIIV